MKIRLLHLDGSLMAQPTLAGLAQEGLAQTINLKPEADALRLWARREHMVALARRLTEDGPPPGKGAEITFMGSGDFHHLTAPLVARHAKEKLSIVHFDNHPDWGKWPPAYHCGSWVNRVLEMDHVAKLVTIGPCAGTTWPQIKGGNAAAVDGNRYELHPWRMGPAKVLGRQPVMGGNLAGRDWPGFVADLARRLPTQAVYVTIDKDVLHPDEALTNWNQGEMRMDHILACLGALAAHRRIVGVDVCGEYAPPKFPSLPKRLLARFDQPTPPTLPDLSVNNAANTRLLGALADLGI